MFNDVTRPMYHAEWSLGEGGEVVRRKRRGGGGGGIKGWDSRWGGGASFLHGFSPRPCGRERRCVRRCHKKIGKTTTATAENFRLGKQFPSRRPATISPAERCRGGKTLFLLLYRKEKGAANFLLRRKIYRSPRRF